jgi:hypothetical protein
MNGVGSSSASAAQAGIAANAANAAAAHAALLRFADASKPCLSLSGISLPGFRSRPGCSLRASPMQLPSGGPTADSADHRPVFGHSAAGMPRPRH